MAELVLAVPGDISAPTGGYRYDARVISELTGRGRSAKALALPGDFPAPSEASIETALKALAGLPTDATLVIDGLAFGALPADGIAALGRPVAALVHHPLALETGLSAEGAARLEASERAALEKAALVIATSEATRTILIERFGVEPRRVRVAEPGVDPQPRAKGGGETPVVLSVGAVTPRKNHAALARAFGTLADLPWRWVIAGALDRDPACAEALKREIEAAGIADRTDLLGAVDDDRLAQAFDGADVFALPSRFEGYGMAVTEALARGLPVVAGRGEAAEALVTERAGALVEPDDVEGLGEALRVLLESPGARAKASNAARSRAARLPRWFQCADVFEHLMDRGLPPLTAT